jgi:hypothetical protein
MNHRRKVLLLLIFIVCIISYRAIPGPDAIQLSQHPWFEGKVTPERAERLIRFIMSIDQDRMGFSLNRHGGHGQLLPYEPREPDRPSVFVVWIDALQRRYKLGIPIKIRQSDEIWIDRMHVYWYLVEQPTDERHKRAYTVQWLSRILSEKAGGGTGDAGIRPHVPAGDGLIGKRKCPSTWPMLGRETRIAYSNQ